MCGKICAGNDLSGRSMLCCFEAQCYELFPTHFNSAELSVNHLYTMSPLIPLPLSNHSQLSSTPWIASSNSCISNLDILRASVADLVTAHSTLIIHENVVLEPALHWSQPNILPDDVLLTLSGIFRAEASGAYRLSISAQHSQV